MKIASASTWLHRRKRTQDHQRHVDVIRLKTPFDKHIILLEESMQFQKCLQKGCMPRFRGGKILPGRPNISELLGR